MKLILTVVLIGLSSLFAQQESLKLPHKRPSNFEFEYKTYGGMYNFRSELKISKDSCSYSQIDQNVKTYKKFALSDEELDKFYQLLKENKFDNIDADLKKAAKPKTTVINDGGKVAAMSVLWDKKEIGHSEDLDYRSDSEKDEWKKNWDNIVNAVYLIIANHTNIGQK